MKCGWWKKHVLIPEWPYPKKTSFSWPHPGDSILYKWWLYIVTLRKDRLGQCNFPLFQWDFTFTSFGVRTTSFLFNRESQVPLSPVPDGRFTISSSRWGRSVDGGHGPLCYRHWCVGAGAEYGIQPNQTGCWPIIHFGGRRLSKKDLAASVWLFSEDQLEEYLDIFGAPAF